jgi:hypothetical protein
MCVCHYLQGHRITDDEQWDFEGDFFAREGYACHGEAVVHVVRRAEGGAHALLQ